MSNFYARLRDTRCDDDHLAACIERVVNQLETEATTSDRPGMLLGKIQSGKTRGFVGVIARAFDKKFDIALVLTKGINTLSAQTIARLNTDFSAFIEEDELLVLDIMKLPGKLRGSELNRKIVIVAKKQADNLSRLIKFISAHDSLKNRRVLLIDDEADLASIRFTRKQGNPDTEQGKISEQIDNLRRLMVGIAFLQVTATPYSLYLQPDDYEESTEEIPAFKPKKPAFTELLPIHRGYVGGNDYFGEHNEYDPRHYLIVKVDSQEQDSLRRADKRRIQSSTVLNNKNTVGICRAIITFVLAVCVRRWQQQEAGEKKHKYAMIIHNDTQRAAHAWQDQIIDWIFKAILSDEKSTPQDLKLIFDTAFDDLKRSVLLNRGKMPSSNEAFDMFSLAFQSDNVVCETVNSDKDVMALLDDKAELKLRTPFNIYIGGNILDRGITIPNLIAFYYGRNPKAMQADTVLQHSRMYGNRSRDDLAVTRFYTSQDVYSRLYEINEFENALRDAFQSGAHDQGVVFIQTDARQKVRSCAPNKILLSNIVAVRPNGILLPTGFQAAAGNMMTKIQNKLERLIEPKWRDNHKFIEIDRERAFDIFDIAEQSMIFEGIKFEWDAMRGLVDYYSAVHGNGDRTMLLIAETGRKLDRSKSGDKSGLSILGPTLRSTVLSTPRTKPFLILLRQDGGKEHGWTSHKFWWPILVAPSNVAPCIFASKTAI